MRNILLFLTITILFTACSSKHAPLETVKQVDLDRYLGKWYEIARFEHKFEKDCKNVTATYSLKDNSDIEVVNRCEKITSGKKTKAVGTAYSVDNTNAKLRVSFFRPFYGDYWILYLDKDYKHVLVGSPSREYLWILARDKTISNETKTKILEKVPSLGFDKNKFIWTVQD